MMKDEEKSFLKNAEISETEPGTVIADVEALVRFIETGKLLATTRHQLPMKSLFAINDSMTSPFQVALARPQQKAFPNLAGLYLVARSAGLVVVDKTGKKPLLKVDESVLGQWRELNATEKYGHLLEAWFLAGDPEIIDEASLRWTGFYIEVQFTFFDWTEDRSLTPKKGIRDGIGNGQSFGYHLGYYNLALLELFGFVRTEKHAVVKGQGWDPGKVSLTTWGEKALPFVLGIVDNARREGLLDGAENEDFKFGFFRKHFQPFFPEWKKDLVLTSGEFRKGRYVFKVSLGRDIWRKIAVSAEHSLDTLASAILDAFDFDHDHLYEFSFRSPRGTTMRYVHEYMDSAPYADETYIGDIPVEVKDVIRFLFDFGDNWVFSVMLEKIEDETHPRDPEVIEEHGEAPEQY